MFNIEIRSLRGLAVTGVATALTVLVLAACTSTPAPAGSPAPLAAGGVSASPATPSSVPSSDPIASGAPGPSVAPSAKPTPVPTAVPAVWTKPLVVPGTTNCGSVVAVIDASGGEHLAADCQKGDLSEVRYGSSSGGSPWKVMSFAIPANRLEDGAQLAIDRSTLYLAYTRLAPTDGGCGDDGLEDVGVYVRTRALPDGDWSDPRQIGASHDELQSFRVASGTLFATVLNDKDGKTYFETAGASGPTNQRFAISGVTGGTALRIGDDGRAR